jgi:hypothetical protein
MDVNRRRGEKPRNHPHDPVGRRLDPFRACTVIVEQAVRTMPLSAETARSARIPSRLVVSRVRLPPASSVIDDRISCLNRAQSSCRAW